MINRAHSVMPITPLSSRPERPVFFLARERERRQHSGGIYFIQFPISSFQTTLLFRSDQRARRGHALPRSMELYPGIEKSFPVHVGLAFLRPFDSKHSDHYSDIPVHLD